MTKKGKSEKVEKSTENVKESTNKSKKENKNGGGLCRTLFNYLVILTSILTVVISVAAYFIVSEINYVPPMPKIDIDEYWGPEGTNYKDTAIRPYRIVFTEAMQEQIRTLFELYRRNTQSSRGQVSLERSAWTYGVNSTDFATFMTNWIFEYSFRERSKFLNKYPHFKTRVQGLDLHYMHVKPSIQNKDIKVYPLLLLHGWPGSIREFYEVIPRLTNVREGYDFTFEVIVPSLPGFIYSEAATRPGMSPDKMAIIIRNLMHRIGHSQYFIQGGDFGHLIGSHLATMFPNEVLGFHTNFPVNFSKGANWLWVLGSLWPSAVAPGLESRMYPLVKKAKFLMQESGYFHLQATKPDTISIALQDSPVGLAAYMVDRIMILTDPKNRKKAMGGLNKHYSLEKLFDNIMLYWDSKSIGTALRLFKETVRTADVQHTLARIPTSVPTWALRLKFEVVQHSDFLLRLKYPNLVGSTNLEGGGHFAAFERPKTFVDDVYKGVQAILNYKKPEHVGFLQMLVS